MAIVSGQVRTAPENTEIRRGWRFVASFEIRDFRFLWFSTIMAFLAMGMQMVGRGYLAYELTGSGAALGIVSLALGLPQVVVAPVAGVFADRFSKRLLLVASLSALFVLTLVNAILISTGVIEIWHLIVLGFIQGAVFAFNMPARQALLPAVVGRDNLANAIALNNAGMNFVQVAGPAAAGLLIAVPGFGLAGVFYAMSFCYLISLLTIFGVSTSSGQGKVMSGSILQEIGAGVRYIIQRPKLRRLVVMTSIVVLLAMPYQILMPLFALRVHDVGPEGLGLLTAFTGAGALVGAVIMVSLSTSTRLATYQIIAGIAFGVTLAGFAVAPTYALALGFVFLVGATSNVYMALNNTLLMVDSDPEMQGRIMSVVMMNFALMPIAALPMSVLADSIGAPLTVASAGAITALIVVGLNLGVLTRLFTGPRHEPDTPPIRPVG
jgi:MFS family permease